ncbi:MAG: 6,7-dimethyl-8-ribityllumazine synthase [Planctomycetes bacterium]|nr:6,7-dimethyl-8-ribityllumazine synthase [Planctomycetota bacterium]
MPMLEGPLDGDGLRIGIVVARFNEFVTRALLEGARRGLAETGLRDFDRTEVWVPGAVEIPLLGQALLGRDDCDAVIGLGCVIRGDTAHFDYVCKAVTEGCTRVALDAGKPFIFGVLTVDRPEQALERAGDGPDNKGFEAALAAVEMARLNALVRRPRGDRA